MHKIKGKTECKTTPETPPQNKETKMKTSPNKRIFQQLAKALVPQARQLRDFFIPLLCEQIQRKEGLLVDIYEEFKGKKKLDLREFADVFAQMIVYGLFIARIPSTKDLTFANIETSIPQSFIFFHEIVWLLKHFGEELYRPLHGVIEEILAILNKSNLEDFPSNEDPYVHFYEDFLKEYDPEQRRDLGVFYTPLPLVTFIVKGVDSLLRHEFGLKDGLANENVTALDFATGTGTFLLEMFRTVCAASPEKDRNLVIKNHLLKNFSGFEIMRVPYTIAHLKLSEFLKENGYEFAPDERVGVFLKNTLVDDDTLII